MNDNYHYGAIGNCQSAALVSKTGSIDWCCLPNFDSAFVFAKILDEKKGGEFSIEVGDDFRVEQEYMENTNILVTHFWGRHGSFDLIDFMPRYRRNVKGSEYFCPPDIVRIFRWISGKPTFRLNYNPRLNYGRVPTKNQIVNNYLKSTTSEGDQYESLYLYSNLDLGKIRNSEEITLEDDSYALVSYNQKILEPTSEEINLQLQKTKTYWMDWVFSNTKHAKYNQAINRSSLVLKLMASQETGAVMAALTTSLPETIGEERNWDYRFCWIRDASMTISVLTELGHNSTVRRYIQYILSLINYKDEAIQIMYGLRGEKKLEEFTLEHLSGYQGSFPVRVGNAAYEQKQNDVYGILIDVIYKSTKVLNHQLDTLENIWTIVRTLVRSTERHWKEPDRGIWELRGRDEHFVFSKVLCWVAVDRGVKIAELFGQQNYVDEWIPLRDRIAKDIHENGWNEEKQAYTQFYGSEHMDAANLLMEEYGFLDAKDPKYISTVKAIKEELCHEGLMFRYKNADDFGEPKSSFTVCTFWMVNALTRIGEKEEAREMFEKLLTYSNHVGLFSEDIDFETKRLLGNFPQAYSHLALISCAVSLGGHGLPEDYRLFNQFHD